MSAKHCGRPNRSGFTLVEVLLVVAVIALLAAMLLPAVFGALQRAEDARVITELEQISNALKAYKAKYGELPPTMNQNDPNRYRKLAAHIERAFPRHRYFNGATNLDSLKGTSNPGFNVPRISGTTSDPGKTVPLYLRDLDAAEMYVFALGGLPYEQNGNRGLEGFSTDLSAPFQNGVMQKSRVPTLFEFENARLDDKDGDGWWEYLPPNGSNVPYVYFREQDYTVKNASGTVTAIAAWPVQPVAPNTAVKPKHTELICAGSDRIFVTQTTGGTNLRTDATYIRFLPGGFARKIGQSMQAQAGDNLSDDYSDTLTNFNPARLGNLR